MSRPVLSTLIVIVTTLSVSCVSQNGESMKFTGAAGEVKLMTLDPGHFHAALVQKTMYEQVSPTVYVYAPDGPDLEDHLARISGFNSRSEDPTAWEENVYRGDDFIARMIAEKPGNVMITSGNNRKKTEYIKAAVDAGVNVLSDKPMCINREGFELLKAAFESARRHDVLLYDIMTERYEITTMLQKELASIPELFGQLVNGTPEQPAVTKESVHHLFKYVAGNPIKRPGWYFDVEQQGEGIVDVATHLVDLVMWECFPGEIIDAERDIRMLSARHWPTRVSREQFAKVTQLPDFPDYLKAKLDGDGVLLYYCNGEMSYTLKGIHARVSVIWNFEAPAGSGDTHFSIMRGTKADVIIRQGAEQNYRPELYVETAGDETAVGSMLKQVVSGLNERYPGLELRRLGAAWHIMIPDVYRVGHEAHFGQVTEKYLRFLVEGSLPHWEVPNMIAKYHTTTSALEMAQ